MGGIDLRVIRWTSEREMASRHLLPKGAQCDLERKALSPTLRLMQSMRTESPEHSCGRHVGGSINGAQRWKLTVQTTPVT